VKTNSKRLNRGWCFAWAIFIPILSLAGTLLVLPVMLNVVAVGFAIASFRREAGFRNIWSVVVLCWPVGVFSLQYWLFATQYKI